MFTWIKTQMLGGFEGLSFPKEPIVWLAFIAALANAAIALLNGDIALWPDGIESIAILIGGFMGRGMVTPVSK